MLADPVPPSLVITARGAWARSMHIENFEVAIDVGVGGTSRSRSGFGSASTDSGTGSTANPLRLHRQRGARVPLWVDAVEDEPGNRSSTGRSTAGPDLKIRVPGAQNACAPWSSATGCEA